MSAHTEAKLPAYIERDLTASLEKLGIAAGSEDGQAAREKAFERHQNKLQAARLRRASKKVVERAAADAAPALDCEADAAEETTAASSPVKKRKPRAKRVKLPIAAELTRQESTL